MSTFHIPSSSFHLKSSTFAPAFRVIAGRKIGELPVMLRWNDTTNLNNKFNLSIKQWI